jgi:hypothetical protein
MAQGELINRFSRLLTAAAIEGTPYISLEVEEVT